MNSNRPAFLTRSEAADYVQSKNLRCSKTTLGKYACVGGGPPYQVFGNMAFYTTANLDAWIEEKLSPLIRSTSDRTVANNKFLEEPRSRSDEYRSVHPAAAKRPSSGGRR